MKFYSVQIYDVNRTTGKTWVENEVLIKEKVNALVTRLEKKGYRVRVVECEFLPVHKPK